MKSFKVTRQIDAPASKVWSILSDPAQLAAPEFGILSVSGQIAPNGRITLVSEVNPKRSFSLQVKDYEANHSMIWTGGLPFGLFTGRRAFRLQPQEEGTYFTMEERFTGALAGLFTKHMPDLTASFEKFGDALKERAEA